MESKDRRRLFDVVEQRVRRVQAERAFDAVFEPGAVEDADALAATVSDPVHTAEDLNSSYVLGYFRWFRYQALTEPDDQVELVRAVDLWVPCWIDGESWQLPEPIVPLLANQVAPFAIEFLQASGPGDAVAVRTAPVLLSRICDATHADHPNRAGRLSNLGAALQSRFERFGDRVDLDAAVAVGRAAVEATSADHPDRAGCLSNLSIVLRLRFERFGDRADLDAAVEVGRVAVEATPADPRDRPAILTNVVLALGIRFEEFGDRADLDAAVTVGRAAVEATPADHRDRASYLSNLVVALQSRFDRFGDWADLDAAVTVGRAAVEATPVDHPDRAGCLSNLGVALQSRFERFGDRADLDAAVEVGRAAVEATPADHRDRAGYLSNLGAALKIRFDRFGDWADLDAAVSASRAAVEATPADHRDRAGYLSNLGAALQIRFDRFGDRADLDDAVMAVRAAVEATPADHPARAGRLSNLGTALQIRSDRIGDSADLDAGVTAIREAVEATPVDHPDRATYLSNLGVTLQSRFERFGDWADLDAAVAVGVAAVEATPVDHPARAGRLSNLGVTLQSRFERFGDRADLDAAVAAGRAAVEATPADHRDRAGRLSNLGVTLQSRFERFGDRADLDAAVAVGRAAVEATPADHRDRAAYLSNLGVTLQSRFERFGDRADLDAAVTVGRAAVEATPADHRDRAGCLSNLGVTLQSRFERFGDRADLDAAVEVGRAAVEATHADHRDRPVILTNVGLALRIRFEEFGDWADLDDAVTVGRAAVEATPVDHPARAGRLSNLGLALTTRFARSGELADRDAAVAAWVGAVDVEAAPPSVRVSAGRAAARVLGDFGPVAQRMLAVAVELLVECAPRQASHGDRQHGMTSVSGVASAAAAAVLGPPDVTPDQVGAERAVLLLEQGRAVLLGQALETRTDLTDLQASRRDLADRFLVLRDLLDTPDTPGNTGLMYGGADVPVLSAVDRHQTVADFRGLLDQIRSIEGFEAFLLPLSVAELTAQAGDGPVVVVNVAERRADAFVIAPSGVSTVPLTVPVPAAEGDQDQVPLTQALLIDQINQFHAALRTCLDTTTDSDGRLRVKAGLRRHAENTLHGVLGWLWDVVADPVLTELGYTSAPDPGVGWPRVWWATGGLLGLLPVHAAGHHIPDPNDPAWVPGRTVLDRVVSSYTPTVRALKYAREPRGTASTDTGTAVVVAMPTTPGANPLPHTVIEARAVAAQLRGAVVEDTGGTTTGEVITRLAGGYRIAHFACHGVSDPVDPSMSRLLFADHLDNPFTVTTLAGLRLRGADLAFLSACETALAHPSKVLDESIHLASGFQMAGFTHVIATMWPIRDDPALADAFYRELLKRTPAGVPLDTTQCAAALHHVVRVARDRDRHHPSRWAAHLHTGT